MKTSVKTPEKGLSDIELSALIKAGNPDAFSELAERYLSLVRIKVLPYRCAMLDGDDLCQEGLMGLYSAACSFQPEGTASFRTYAAVCIENRILSAYRKATNDKNRLLNVSVPLFEKEGLFSPEEENPEARIMAMEGFELLKHKIEKNLSKMEQKVLRSYLNGNSYSEIAVQLKITAKAADNALQRARLKLRQTF
ncbi:sigma-70 family RNA polymerase sigma factor [Caproicibacterium sp. BJN0003]|uniref:sigma-70 family RNA polymerase sigma factor n=1 Tax=Caproicibacterium sp. BJN0003 TaxID=2994078 RepID=UPI0022562BBB|nr:sigma-70 family RNA polymerase sigma factor [Caproicibacterium sp. BJN0003]UZT83281.1 sigma-70 family RNA polymerase sigma factor [Caproicibacterium sp. BJN0003]